MQRVVLVHGLWMPGAALGLLRHRLAAAGFNASLFRYASVAADLDTSAAKLAAYLQTFSDGPVHLVGHSLGGLVMAKLVERHGIEPLRRLVCLGSPFRGCIAGDRLARLPGGVTFLGRGMAQMRREASGRRWDGRRELGVIAGRLGLGLGRLLGGLPVPNDGTVAVLETRLDGATDHIVLPVTHFSMLCSRAVAAQTIAFLRNGRFDRRT